MPSNKFDYDRISLSEMNYSPSEESSAICNPNSEVATIDSAQNTLFENLPVCNFGKINIDGSPCNFHVGTEIIINGPAYVTSLTRLDVLALQENCRCCATKKIRKIQEQEDNSPKFIKLIKRIKRNWKVKKCILLGASITFIEILAFYYFLYDTYEQLLVIDRQISSTKMERFNKNLNGFVTRLTWNYSTNCSHQCVKMKTRIKIDIPQNVSIEKSESLYRLNISEAKINEFEHIYKENPTYGTIQLNDIYYNYMIGLKGFIYEGRELTCPFDENFPKEDNHAETLVIGLLSCFPDIKIDDKFKLDAEKNKNMFIISDTVTQLLNRFRKSYIIKKDSVLLFSPDCSKTDFAKRLINWFNRKVSK